MGFFIRLYFNFFSYLSVRLRCKCEILAQVPANVHIKICMLF